MSHKISRSLEKRILALDGVVVRSAIRSRHWTKSKPVLRGSPVMMIWITLPFPPALNHLYANTENGRVLSKNGKSYKQEVYIACNDQGIAHCIGRLTVEIWAYPPDNRKRDIDGMLKIVLDSLQEAGVYGNDSQIDTLTIHRGKVTDGGKMTVMITGDYPR